MKRDWPECNYLRRVIFVSSQPESFENSFPDDSKAENGTWHEDFIHKFHNVEIIETKI